MARPRARSAMFDDLRRPVIGRDQDIGEGLIVAQQHIEAWPQPLDQVGFKQQRLGLGAGNDEFERAGRPDHAFDAGVEAGRTRIGANAVTDVFRLADIEHVAARIDHAVHARPGRSELGVAEDGGAAGGQRTIGLLDTIVGQIDFVRLRKRRLLVLLGVLDFWLEVFFRNAHPLGCSNIIRLRFALSVRGRVLVDLGSLLGGCRNGLSHSQSAFRET